MNTIHQLFKKGIALVVTLVISITMIYANDLSTDITASAADQTTIATLTIFSDISCGEACGTHSFLYIYNKCSHDLNVLGYYLKPSTGMTIGTFGNCNNGKGIYINLEAFRINRYNNYSSRVSLTMNLTYGKLNTLNNTMRNNNKWTTSKNCAWFAKTCWNSVCVSSKKINTTAKLDTPRGLYNFISNHSKKSVNKKIINCINDENYIYRYTSKGKLERYKNDSGSSGSSSF